MEPSKIRIKAEKANDVEYDWSLAFESPLLQAAADYVRDKFDATGRITRTDIRPAAIAPFVGILSLCDPIFDGDALVDLRLRLQATASVEVYGELTGRFASDVLPGDVLSRWLYTLGETWRAEKPLRTNQRITFEEKTFLVGESLNAPVWTDAGEKKLLMTCFDFHPVIDK